MTESIDVTTARAAIENERTERIQACSTAVQAALDDHGCVAVPIVTIRGIEVSCAIEIQAKE